MADIGGKSSRLRRTFRYPTGDDDPDSSEPEALDEEEQEDLIKNLAERNTSNNATYTRILLALPLLTTVAYIPALLRPSAGAPRLPSLLALTSLISTAFLLYALPPTVTGIEALDLWQRQQSGGGGGAAGGPATAARSVAATAPRSPLEMWLPYLNLGLVFMLMFLGLVSGSEAAGVGWIGLGNLPAIVYGVVVAAKLIMGSVDPESELTALRYEYKGA